MEHPDSLFGDDLVSSLLERPIAATIPHNDTDVLFTYEPGAKISFQLSSLCKAFGISPDAFEHLPAREISLELCKEDDIRNAEFPPAPESSVFLSESDVFSSSLGTEPTFLRWYFDTAVPSLRDFSYEYESENQKRLLRHLQNKLFRAKNAIEELLTPPDEEEE